MQRDKFKFDKILKYGLLATSPFGIIMSILSAFNLTDVKLDNEKVTGLTAFITSIRLFLFSGLMFAITTWLILNFGSWLDYHLFPKENKRALTPEEMYEQDTQNKTRE